MFKELLQRIRSVLSPVPPESARRYKLIEDRVERLPLEEARALAHHVLDNPEWFRTERGDASVSLPSMTPGSVRDFYRRYVRTTGRFCDVQPVAAECGPSEARPEMLRVSRDDAHVELCTQGTDDRVYLVANDVGPEEAVEGSVPSVYHPFVRAAAVLEYVSGPAAA